MCETCDLAGRAHDCVAVQHNSGVLGHARVNDHREREQHRLGIGHSQHPTVTELTPTPPTLSLRSSDQPNGSTRMWLGTARLALQVRDQVDQLIERVRDRAALNKIGGVDQAGHWCHCRRGWCHLGHEREVGPPGDGACHRLPELGCRVCLGVLLVGDADELRDLRGVRRGPRTAPGSASSSSAPSALNTASSSSTIGHAHRGLVALDAARTRCEQVLMIASGHHIDGLKNCGVGSPRFVRGDGGNGVR